MDEKWHGISFIYSTFVFIHVKQFEQKFVVTRAYVNPIEYDKIILFLYHVS